MNKSKSETPTRSWFFFSHLFFCYINELKVGILSCFYEWVIDILTFTPTFSFAHRFFSINFVFRKSFEIWSHFTLKSVQIRIVFSYNEVTKYFRNSLSLSLIPCRFVWNRKLCTQFGCHFLTGNRIPHQKHCRRLFFDVHIEGDVDKEILSVKWIGFLFLRHREK